MLAGVSLPEVRSVPIYSHSRLSVYETCPRQYRFQYVERLEVPEVESVEMFLGSRVHEALEMLYENVRRGRVPPLEGLLEVLPGGLAGDLA